MDFGFPMRNNKAGPQSSSVEIWNLYGGRGVSYLNDYRSPKTEGNVKWAGIKILYSLENPLIKTSSIIISRRGAGNVGRETCGGSGVFYKSKCLLLVFQVLKG